MKVINEKTLMQRWMKCWLNYLYWYWAKAMSPEVSLEELLDSAPIVTTHWSTRQSDNL